MVTTPVRRLLRMAVSMVEVPRSPVRARVAELEALVDEGEVRDDGALRRERDGGPVREARRAQVVAVDAAGGVAAEPVDGGAARRLHRRDADLPGRQGPRHLRAQRP